MVPSHYTLVLSPDPLVSIEIFSLAEKAVTEEMVGGCGRKRELPCCTVFGTRLVDIGFCQLSLNQIGSR